MERSRPPVRSPENAVDYVKAPQLFWRACCTPPAVTRPFFLVTAGGVS